MFPRAVSMRLLDVFGARACAAEFVSTVGVGYPGLLVVTGVLLIVRVLDGAFRVWLLHADLSHGKKGERLSPALVHQMAGGRQSVCVMQQILCIFNMIAVTLGKIRWTNPLCGSRVTQPTVLQFRRFPGDNRPPLPLA
jgi:hypothetical protein